jgi:ACS family tartrate transporter-like MFS transporter
MVAMTVALMGIYCFYGPFWTLPSQFLSEGSAAVGIATINSVAMIGGFVGPFVVGYLTGKTGNVNFGLYYLCALLCLTFVLVITMRIPVDKKRT